ncbi:MAG TPA: CPBP family intramembrane glutamic endopeptidase [Thermomicrobiales bacterium]|nr:CPBP family intramembrane glutamic endopeptidase [Thermomicrobiales bacterium]
MAPIEVFIKRHPVLTYFAVVFAISWGSSLVLFGPGVFLGSKEISFVGAGPLAYLAFLAGPSVAGLLLAGLVHGRTGLRDVRLRLSTWRVGVRWYAVAFLTAPLLTTATLLTLSLTSPVFLPAIITADDKASLLVPAVVVGLAVPTFEELGWTGFAIPELAKRHGLLGTGLIVGLLWGAWHFPLFSASAGSAGAIPPALYVVALLFSWLPPYRVLMVWVYDHTKSLLVAMLMHVPIAVSPFILSPTATVGADLLIQVLVFGGALWAVVAVVAVADGGHLAGQPLRRRVA